MAALNPLSPWQRQALYGSCALLVASGLAWLLLHYLWGAGAGELPHPLEPWMMRVHGAAGFAALFMGGVVAAQHVPRGWRATRAHPRMRQRWAFKRRSGLALCVLGGLLASTGYALYYFAPDTLRPALGWVHAGIGLLLAGLLPLHSRHHGTLGA